MNAHQNKSLDLCNNQILWVYQSNACKLAVIDSFCEHSPIEADSKTMTLCDYDVATHSNIITYSLIFIECIIIFNQ